MTGFRDYYRRELEALYRSGAAFADAEPQLARRLQAAATDPDVERLLQGVAFLSARIRQMHDGELPQLARTLLEALYPALLRPVPAASIVQFGPAEHARFDSMNIAAGTAVRARDDNGAAFGFRTRSEVALLPLAPLRCEQQARAAATRLRLSLAALPELRDDWVLPASLRFYINRPLDQAAQWYRLLLSRLTTIAMQVRGRHHYPKLTLAPGHLSPWGFADGDALWTGAGPELPALRLLREYFCFPERFLFLQLQLPAEIRQCGRGGFRELFVDLDIDQPLPSTLPFAEDLLLLHCTPAVNLYPLPARPFQRSVPGGEWPLRPERQHEALPQIHEVISVTGIRSDRGEPVPFSLCEAGALCGGDDEHSCQVLRRPADGVAGVQTLLSFPLLAPADPAAPTWVMSAELLCSDGSAAGQLLPGDIDELSGQGQDWLCVRNVTAASRAWPAPQDIEHYWPFISKVVAGQSGMMSLQDLRDTLLLANVPLLHDAVATLHFRRRLDGIRAMYWKTVLRHVHGAAISGRRCQLTLDSRQFAMDEGLYLFLKVLAVSLDAMSPLNSFTELTVTDENGQTLAHFAAEVAINGDGPPS